MASPGVRSPSTRWSLRIWRVRFSVTGPGTLPPADGRPPPTAEPRGARARGLRTLEGRRLVFRESRHAAGPRAAAAHTRPDLERAEPADLPAGDRRREERRAPPHPA